MTRRDLIALLGSTAAAWPRAGWTQQPEGMRRLGVLMNVGEASAVGQRALVLFKEALERLGWSDERNLQLTVRWAAGEPALQRRVAHAQGACACAEEAHSRGCNPWCWLSPSATQ
jgi:putative tryptophan/tyrosine transport system substrate-binding protein